MKDKLNAVIENWSPDYFWVVNRPIRKGHGIFVLYHGILFVPVTKSANPGDLAEIRFDKEEIYVSWATFRNVFDRVKAMAFQIVEGSSKTCMLHVNYL